MNKIISQTAAVAPIKNANSANIMYTNTIAKSKIPIKPIIYNLLTIKRPSLPTRIIGQSRSLLLYHATLIERARSTIERYIYLRATLAAIRQTYIPTRSQGTRAVYQTTTASNTATKNKQTYNKLFHFALSINPLIKALSEPFLRLANFLTLAFWALLTQETMRTNFSAIWFSITNNLLRVYGNGYVPVKHLSAPPKNGLTATIYAY